MDGDQLADIADQYASERRFKEAQEVISTDSDFIRGIPTSW